MLNIQPFCHALRGFLHAIGFAPVFQQKLCRVTQQIQLLFFGIHKSPFCPQSGESAALKGSAGKRVI